MAFDQVVQGFGIADSLRDSPEPQPQTDLRRTRRPNRTGRKSAPQPAGVRPDAQRPAAGDGPDPKTLVIQVDGKNPSNIKAEDREKATGILQEVGQRFADNRRKGKSNAYEEYQRDLAENAQFLVLGGLASVKELTELFMKIEDFRKQSSEQGKNPATILGEWLRGEETEETRAVESLLTA
jgi:hypothetical protein